MKPLCAVLNFAALLIIGFASIQVGTPTGAVVDNMSFADLTEVTANRLVQNFLDTSRLEFPLNECGRVAQDAYNSIAHKNIGLIREHPANNNKMLVLGFGTAESLGVIQLQKLSLSAFSPSENTILSIKSSPRFTNSPQGEVTIQVFGLSKSNYKIKRGRVTTRQKDCSFFTQGNQDFCTCRR